MDVEANSLYLAIEFMLDALYSMKNVVCGNVCLLQCDDRDGGCLSQSSLET